MRWTVVVICGLVVVLVTQVSALFFPIIWTAGTTATTATTLTVGTGGLALGGLAIAGIIGLGLAAALLAGGNDEPSYGHHATAPRYHASAPSYHAPEPSYHEPVISYGRRKRSSQFDSKATGELFAMVAQVDSLGCGMRLVCQVFQKRREDLTPQERGIRKFIGEKPLPVPSHKINEPKARYVSAAILGLRNSDCYKIYEACPLTDDDVKAYLLNLDTKLAGIDTNLAGDL